MNFVGYTTVENVAANQYVALGVVFENVSGGEIAVKDLVTVASPVGGVEIGAADQIWKWNTETSTWTKYFHYYSARQGADRWVVSTDTSVETTDTIPAGETVFFLRASTGAATSLTLSGGVKDLTGSKSFTVSANQLAFASNPWPLAINIKDFNSYFSSGSAVGGVEIGAADQIWLWDSATSKWTKYFYYYSARQGADRWVISTDTATETTDTIPAGVGFFFQRASTGSAATVTLTNE